MIRAGGSLQGFVLPPHNPFERSLQVLEMSHDAFLDGNMKREADELQSMLAWLKTKSPIRSPCPLILLGT